jgi:hypothetical protein
MGGIFHYGPGTSPVLQGLRVDARENEADLFFDIEALAGVAYGLQMTSDMSSNSWETVPYSLWNPGWTPPEYGAGGQNTTNGLLTIRVSSPPIEGQKFFRAVLVKP